MTDITIEELAALEAAITEARSKASQAMITVSKEWGFLSCPKGWAAGVLDQLVNPMNACDRDLAHVADHIAALESSGLRIGGKATLLKQFDKRTARLMADYKVKHG